MTHDSPLPTNIIQHKARDKKELNLLFSCDEIYRYSNPERRINSTSTTFHSPFKAKQAEKKILSIKIKVLGKTTGIWKRCKLFWWKTATFCFLDRKWRRRWNNGRWQLRQDSEAVEDEERKMGLFVFQWALGFLLFSSHVRLKLLFWAILWCYYLKFRLINM